MSRYEWSCLNHLQVGKYAEYFVKMEFTMYGWQVYSTEVDDRGIDFVVRDGNGGFFEIQVKSVRQANYIFIAKDKFLPKASLIAAIVLFTEGEAPQLYLIPSMRWQSEASELLVSRDYKDKKSKPEWGINFSTKNQKLLDAFLFDQMVATLGK